jgi:serine/threonine protein kinase
LDTSSGLFYRGSPQHPSIFSERCNPSVLFDSVIPLRDFVPGATDPQQRKIGAGAFGEVFEVTNNDKTFAVKYCRPLARRKHEQSASYVGVDKVTGIVDLIREVLVLNYLSHPCVLLLLGWNFRPDLFDSRFLFKMPMLSGSLAIVEKRPADPRTEPLIASPEPTKSIIIAKLSPTERNIIAHSIAFGMEHVSSRSVVHRDLKPDNILVDQFFWARISDFGLSRHFAGDQNSMPNRGNALYAAP